MIDVEPYVLPGLYKNVLALMYIITMQGPVLFKSSGVYPIPEMIIGIEILADTMATFSNDAHYTHATIQGNHKRREVENTHHKWRMHSKTDRIAMGWHRTKANKV